MYIYTCMYEIIIKLTSHYRARTASHATPTESAAARPETWQIPEGLPISRGATRAAACLLVRHPLRYPPTL